MWPRWLARYLPAAGLAVAGTAAALLCVWLATGWMDGFSRGDTRWLGQRFVALAPWALGLALVMGVLIRWSCSLALRRKPLGLLIAIPRAFLVFAIYGFVVLIGGLLCTFAALLLWGLSRMLRLMGATSAARWMRPRKGLFEWLALPIWMIAFPFMLVNPEAESELPTPEVESLRRRLLWLLPVLIPFIFLWTGAVSEDTGSRVDPFWLAAAAAYWLSDLLIVSLQVVPRLQARARRAGAPPPPAHEADNPGV
jgi:hypothetical protein